MFKKSYEINFKTIDKVKSFCNFSFNFSGSIVMKSGRWVVDGKSILGIFSLDLSKAIICEIETESKEELDKFENLVRNLGII